MREIVVARYKENINWLPKSGWHTTVYNKGNSLPDTITLPNVGREANTFLHHIVSRYDSLADLTVFCQGNPFSHSPDFLKLIENEFKFPLSLSKHYEVDWPDKKITVLDKVERFQGHEIRYGRAEYFASEKPEVNIPWLKKVWSVSHLSDEMPSPWYFGYGSIWAVPSRFILHRPKPFWEMMLSASIRDGKAMHCRDGFATAWAFECLWYYLFNLEYLIKFNKNVSVADIVQRRLNKMRDA